MTRRLGPQQLDELKAIGSLGRFLVVPNKITYSLVRAGLVELCGRESFAHITPNGLRALANEIEAGRIPSAKEMFEKMKKKKEP